MAAIVSITAALVIDDILFYEVPKVIEKVRAESKNNKYKYYMALRTGGTVLIGAGMKEIKEATTYGLANINSETAGVFTLAKSDAVTLGCRISNCFDVSDVENHGAGMVGFYDHIHPIMRYGSREVHANLHIWFY